MTRSLSQKQLHLKQTISVLGCGWLGFPLAKALIRVGHLVKGSTTSKDKLEQFKAHHIDGFQIALQNHGNQGDVDGFFKNASIVIVAIPPGMRRNPENNLLQQLKALIPSLKKAQVKHLIFISSTSVYRNTETMMTINEKSALSPETESGKMIASIEEFLSNQSSFTTSILRCSGLFNDSRHPIYSLEGKSNLKHPEGPVNLVHQSDVINIILKLIQSKQYGQAFNLAYPEHPTRIDYYTLKAEEQNLNPPQFLNESISLGKMISSEKVIEVLDYKFQHPI
ncbi:MAG: hypothetical protein BM564_01550 [Bacteroidetes bacterium MedPE-SWsnd-G2]|nr:MAG: hypothetical protein BM564_01550 [Bacteroidetes bacterium MedPE-SWsnd-G2]